MNEASRRAGRFALKTLSPIAQNKMARALLTGLDDFICATLGRGGGSGWDHKGQVTALAKLANVGNRPIILDVGANNGEFVTALHDLIGKHDGEYHLFEPATNVVPHLQQRIIQIPNCTIIKQVVSDVDGCKVFNQATVGSGLGSIYERHDTSIQSREWLKLELPSITLDTYIGRCGIEHIDILKIDVEGAELDVLNGATHALSSGMIDTIMFEFGSANLNSRTQFSDFWWLFKRHGYRIYRVIPGGRYYELEKLDDRDEYYRGPTNYIAKLIQSKKSSA